MKNEESFGREKQCSEMSGSTASAQPLRSAKPCQHGFCSLEIFSIYFPRNDYDGGISQAVAGGICWGDSVDQKNVEGEEKFQKKNANWTLLIRMNQFFAFFFV